MLIDINNKKQTARKLIIITISILAIFLQFIGSYYNKRANDNHTEVTELIVKNLPNKIAPSSSACGQCYHPRLFHMVSALPCIIQGYCSSDQIRISGQMSNAFFASIQIILFAFLIYSFKFTPLMTFIIFSLIALNPRLFVISTQATNDTLAITTGLFTSFFLWKTIKDKKILDVMCLFLSLGMLLASKGNSLPVVAGTGCSLLLSLFIAKKRSDKIFFLKNICLLILLSILLLNFSPSTFTPYNRYFSNMVNNQKLGAVYNQSKTTPFWFDREYRDRPGVISIIDSYFTFRFIDILTNPLITNGELAVPFHRTSLWSQLFGRYHFIYFDQWPYQRIDKETKLIGRITLLLGAVYTIITILGGIRLFCGLFENRKTVWKWWAHRGACLLPVALCMLGMIIVFSLGEIGFQSMKAIYILPAHLPFLTGSFFFLKTLKTSQQFTLIRISIFALISLCICYVANIVLYVQQILFSAS
jgi:hypothetical protein